MAKKYTTKVTGGDIDVKIASSPIKVNIESSPIKTTLKTTKFVSKVVSNPIVVKTDTKVFKTSLEQGAITVKLSRVGRQGIQGLPGTDGGGDAVIEYSSWNGASYDEHILGDVDYIPDWVPRDDPDYLTAIDIAGKADDSQVLTNVPAGALFTDTVYTKPASEPQSYIDGLETALSDKVDKVSGEGLSQNNLTNALKTQYDAAHQHTGTSHFDGQFGNLTNVPANVTALENATNPVFVDTTYEVKDGELSQEQLH